MTGMRWDDYAVDVVDHVVHAKCRRCPPPAREEIHHLPMTNQIQGATGTISAFEAACPTCSSWMRVEVTSESQGSEHKGAT